MEERGTQRISVLLSLFPLLFRNFTDRYETRRCRRLDCWITFFVVICLQLALDPLFSGNQLIAVREEVDSA